MTTKTTNNGDGVVRYEIELTDGEVEALRAAAAILTDHGACVLRHNPNSRRCLGGNVLVELAKQFQAILMREQMPQPIEVGSKVSWNDHFDIFEVFAIAEHPRTGERYALIAAGDIAWRAPADDLRVVR